MTVAVYLLSALAVFSQVHDVRIGRVLPNPRGVDQENEEMTLINTLNSPADLTGWTLRDKYNEIQLTGKIKAREEFTTKVKTENKYAFLDNKGDTISLYDAKGILQDQITYREEQVSMGEWIVLFELAGNEKPQVNTSNPPSAPASNDKDEINPWAIACTIIIVILLLFWAWRAWRLSLDTKKEALRQWLESNPETISRYLEWIKAAESGGHYTRKNYFLEGVRVMEQDKGFQGLRVDLLPENDPVRVQVQNIREFLLNHEQRRIKLNQSFITNEAEEMSEFFDHVEKNPLTKMQRQAVIVNEENNLVIAGAGSGKTSTITARVAYLVKRGLADPSNILVLAFNKAAANELVERIEPLAGPEISVMTFHKFGLNVISEATGQKPDIANSEEDRLGKKLTIQGIIKEACNNEVFAKQLLLYFKYYLVPYQDLTSFENEQEYMSYLAKYEMRTLKGEKVKSYGELLIANFLFLNGVDYEYEAKYEHKTTTRQKRQYKPDFWLPKAGLYIEYLALDRRGNTPGYINKNTYTRDLEWKREIHKSKATKMVELMCYHTMEGNLETELDRHLKQHGVEYRPISPEEAFDEINKFGEITNFARLISSFLSHFKSNRWTFDGLREKAKHHRFADRSLAFINIFQTLYSEYQQGLERLEAIDFDDMISQAVDHLEAGEAMPDCSRFTHILVDEFQDISKGRAKLLSALKKHAPAKTLFCVGDDWQAIYRFAGSDVSIMREFESIFGASETTTLDKTFRFNNLIADFTTDFVLQNPGQIQKSISSLHTVETPQIFLINDSEKESVLLEQALQHINNQALKQEGSVLVLGRYRNSKPDNFTTLIREFPGFSISFMTAHGSKGLEADYVIVLGMNSGKYGFPCQKVDDPVMGLVLPVAEEYEYAEERRLFYVACTRTKNTVYLINGISEKGGTQNALPPSSFLREAQGRTQNVISLGDSSAPNEPCPGRCKGIGVLMRRTGKYGPFWGCSLYYCDYTKKIKDEDAED